MRVQFDVQSAEAITNEIKDPIDGFSHRMIITYRGIELIEQLSYTINSITKMHAHLNTPMTKANVFSICRSIEMFKAMKITFDNHSTSIGYAAQRLSQYYIHQSVLIISRVTNKLLTESAKSASYGNEVVDILSALKLAEDALLSTPSIRRILMARIALSMTDPLKHFSSEQLNKVIQYFATVEYLLQIKGTLRLLSSSSFMYWHHEAMYPYYQRYALDPNGTIDYERIVVSAPISH